MKPGEVAAAASVAPSQCAVEITDLRFGWRPDECLLHIEKLAVRSGERVFIKGPSGSGKSTLLGLIGGVLAPRSGQIRVNGIELSGQGARFRDRARADHIGYIFQMFNLVPYLSVLDNIILPAGFSASRAERAVCRSGSVVSEARRLLAALGLEDLSLANRSVTKLSQGQQQRVAAARALLGSPALIIADEPTSSLDTEARECFLDLLMGECRHADTTLLFVSHDTSLSTRFDRALTLAEINRAGAPGAPR